MMPMASPPARLRPLAVRALNSSWRASYISKGLVRLLKPAVAALAQLFAAVVPSVAANLLAFWRLVEASLSRPKPERQYCRSGRTVGR
jgi:hypothetical protein